MHRTRKPLRLKDYDYSAPGYYFVTFCVKNRECILCDRDTCRGAQCAPVLQTYAPFLLTETGRVVNQAIQQISFWYPLVRVDKYVIMPNHVHMILVINPVDGESGRTVCAPTVSNIIKQLKGFVTKQIHGSIWQRSFHDHIIRNQDDYLNIWQYIDTNPQKWEQDCYYI